MSVAISVSCKRAVVPFRELRLSPSGGNEATASSRTQHGGRRRHEDSRQHEQAVAQDGRKIARDRSRSRRATAISTSFTSPSPISAITLCVRSRSRTSTLSTRSRQARGSSAARLPPAIDRPRRFAQAAPVRAPEPTLRPWHKATAPREPQDRRPVVRRPPHASVQPRPPCSWRSPSYASDIRVDNLPGDIVGTARSEDATQASCGATRRAVARDAGAFRMSWCRSTRARTSNISRVWHSPGDLPKSSLTSTARH